MDMRAEEHRKKRMPSSNRADTGLNVTRHKSGQTSGRCLIVREFEEPFFNGESK